jgi:hypothetical protein
MNIKDLLGKATVDEVAMNPTAYAQSVEQGQAEGVLIGFEFEVCVPAATMKAQAEAAARAAQAAPTEPMTAERVERLIRRGRQNGLWEGNRDEPYTKWDQYFTPRDNSAYPSTMAAKTAITTQRLADAQAALAEFPQDRLANWQRLAKAKIARRMREGYYGRSAAEFTPEQRAFEIIKDIAGRYEKDLYDHPGYRARYNTPAGEAWSALMKPVQKIQAGTNIQPDDVFMAMFTDLNPDQGSAPIFANINQFFTYDPQAVYDAFGLMLRDPDVPDDVRDMARGNSRGGYRGAVKVLKPAVEQTMGADVQVFSNYHQEPKNMTSWYIEPDGSLQPNSGDGAAEVVGPPEAPQQALASLKKFYAMAKELKLYTSKRNNTGLHINVSIPKDLDVLKLAVMTGDQYVLKKFGRENNNYARSIMQNLQSTGGRKVGSTVPSDTTTPFGSTASKIDLSMLQQIAKDISRDHFTSVNFTGKYVSFRHSGGDYLGDYTEILNVVGRFVRAMVIASDPGAYRNEYLKAVAKLVDQRQPLDRDQRTRYIEYIKQNGLVVKTVELYLRKERFENPTTANFAAVVSEYNQQLVPGVNYTITAPSAEAKRMLIAKSRANGRARTEMSNPEISPDQQFARCVLYPMTLQENNHELRSTYRGVDLANIDGSTVGYRFTWLEQIPAADPRAVAFMRKLKSVQGRF